jgi:cytochrome c oxidase cbb3-type subunit 2
MNPGPLVFLVSFLAIAISWTGFVLAPQLQIGRQQQVIVAETGQLYPSKRPGQATQGGDIYRANGCFYCHSQQVRPEGYGSDVNRHWGARNSAVQSVAQDYLYDYPVMIGSQRVGPDLANIGLRQPNAQTLYKHLYDPALVTPGSVMPPYKFLFKVSKLGPGEKPSPDALDLGKDTPPGCQVLPKNDARDLVAYLLSLHSEAILYETPMPAPPATNAPAAPAAAAKPSTNSPAK